MNHPFRCVSLKIRAFTCPQCVDCLLWSSLNWCSTQQVWWPRSLCDSVLPSPQGLAAWARAARAAPVMRNHQKNVTAVTVQHWEGVQPRAVPVLTVGAGRGAAGSEGSWVPSSLFHYQANPLGPLEIKSHLDTVLGNWLKVALLVPGGSGQDDLWRPLPTSTILCFLSFPRRLAWLRCERFLRECEMWPYTFTWCHCRIIWSFNSVLSAFSIKRDLLHFFSVGSRMGILS